MARVAASNSRVTALEAQLSTLTLLTSRDASVEEATHRQKQTAESVCVAGKLAGDRAQTPAQNAEVAHQEVEEVRQEMEAMQADVNEMRGRMVAAELARAAADSSRAEITRAAEFARQEHEEFVAGAALEIERLESDLAQGQVQVCRLEVEAARLCTEIMGWVRLREDEMLLLEEAEAKQEQMCREIEELRAELALAQAARMEGSEVLVGILCSRPCTPMLP